MHSIRPPPAYPEKITVALFGKRVQLKNSIGNMILNDNAFVTTSQNFVVAHDGTFKVINTPDFFDEEYQHPDQQIIDFMALSYPGPDLFILVSDNTQEQIIMAQVRKLQDSFGENITTHLVILLPDQESFASLRHLNGLFNIWLASNENLARECRASCCGRQTFLYDYKNYSQDVVIQRRTALEKRRRDGQPLCYYEGTGNSANGVLDNIFNIVLLGLTGTGKSASANTILTAGNPELDPWQLFKSEPSSMPITTQCEVKIIQKPFGVPVRVVDTPDFFHDELNNSEQQINECKKYLQQGQCVVLLVLQLGRFTDYEQGILERLEDKFGWRIRDSTIVLLTHGEDLRGDLDQYVGACVPLRKIAESCGYRYHLFSNSSRDSRQVIDLIRKIPNSNNIFPKLSKKRSTSQCFIC
uniref:GTPase IMAP family member 8-like n=1 Tax=Scatophagus argus TaxID=75038 RepID=UPI001ED814ED|nr:GTPase IMAP family member 8-like [Scatophagus argus]